MRTQGVVKQNDIVVVSFEKRRIIENSAFEEERKYMQFFFLF